MPTDPSGLELIDTDEVARRLGVRRETVYAYVSRGRLRSVPVDGQRRSHFDPAEVDALLTRSRRPAERRRPLEIETALTAIEPAGHTYRGRSAVELSRTRTFEEVAELLWTAEWPDAPPGWRAPTAALEVARAAIAAVEGPLVRPIDRFRLALDAAATVDPWRHDLSPTSVVDGARALVTAAVCALPTVAVDQEPASTAGRLWHRITTDAPTEDRVRILDATLVLLADHELAASTFAARIAASFSADLGAVLGAALGPFAGARHGAVSLQVEELLEMVEADGATVASSRWLARHERVPGFGHAVYRDEDPRAAELLALLRATFTAAPAVTATDELVELCARRGLPAPNVDLALGALVRAAGWEPGSGQLVFAVARTAGWVAHALEEYARPSPLRPRARYVGPPPDTAIR